MLSRTRCEASHPWKGERATETVWNCVIVSSLENGYVVYVVSQHYKFYEHPICFSWVHRRLPGPANASLDSLKAPKRIGSHVNEVLTINDGYQSWTSFWRECRFCWCLVRVATRAQRELWIFCIICIVYTALADYTRVSFCRSCRTNTSVCYILAYLSL